MEPVIVAKTYKNIRADILRFLAEKKSAQTDFRVVDVGGAAGNWCDDYADAYVDIRSFDTDKKLYVGDICIEKTWLSIPEKSFDFAICTHVLEDIRDPITALKGLQRIAKSGFVATPTKWDELSTIEDILWLGNYHHRWIFDFDSSGKITVVPKSVAANRFMIQNRLLYQVNPLTVLRRVLGRLHLKQSGYLLGPDINRKHWHPRYPECELSFVWRDEIPHDFNDWYPTPRALLDHYREIMNRDLDLSDNVDLSEL